MMAGTKLLRQSATLGVSAPPGTVANMATFALTLGHGPGWDPARPIRQQANWDEHAAFMDGLVEAGFIILGGPLGAGDRTLHLVQATSEPEIRARLAQDPWAKTAHLVVNSIEPWTLWLDSRT